MFSLLFGMGFAVMVTRAESTEREFVKPYIRRIIGLFLFGSAHFVASVVCGPEPTREKRLHCLKAIGYSPWKYLWEYSDRRPHLLETVLGVMYRYPVEVCRRLLWVLRIRRAQ